MLDAHTDNHAAPEAITFADAEEAEMVLESYYETRAELGSSAFFGGASSRDADAIAGMQMGDRFHAQAAAARAYLDGLRPQRPAPVFDLDADDIPF